MFNILKAGEQIAFLRKQNRLTQDELAEKLDISPQAISKWENGHTMPEVSLLPVLAEIFNCTIDTILISDSYTNGHKNYIHMLLPYQDVSPYTGSWWPRSMAFPAVMTALKLFMGFEDRRNFNNHQINDDQEYILQSGISTLAFGFSRYNAEFIHDCFQIYGLDYKTVSVNNKSFEEIITLIKTQIQNGYPVIIQDKSNNAAFLFVTGIESSGQTIRAHEFIEGFDEKNCNMNPYEMEKMDNWLKPDMELLLLYHIDKKISVEEACKNALANYCLIMSGKWDKKEFCSKETSESFKQFMNYGSDGYYTYIYYLKETSSLESFSPQDCILYESVFRTTGFLIMCKEYIKNINIQSLNSAIDKYNTLSQHAHDICDIVGGKSLNNKTMEEKSNVVLNYLIRSNEILIDAVNEIIKAINHAV